MVTTGREEIAARVRRLRDHGQAEKYRHVEEGYNGRLDALQAAILRVKLRRLGEWNDRRRALARLYDEALRDLEGRGGLRLPAEMPWGRHVYHLYAIRVADRARVRRGLDERGIDSGMHYPVPLHLQAAYARLGLGEGSFPEAEAAAREVLTLPLFPTMSVDQVDRTCGALREVLAAVTPQAAPPSAAPLVAGARPTSAVAPLIGVPAGRTASTRCWSTPGSTTTPRCRRCSSTSSRSASRICTWGSARAATPSRPAGSWRRSSRS
jgi:hypothetical protein